MDEVYFCDNPKCRFYILVPPGVNLLKYIPDPSFLYYDDPSGICREAFEEKSIRHYKWKRGDTIFYLCDNCNEEKRRKKMNRKWDRRPIDEMSPEEIEGTSYSSRIKRRITNHLEELASMSNEKAERSLDERAMTRDYNYFCDNPKCVYHFTCDSSMRNHAEIRRIVLKNSSRTVTLCSICYEAVQLAEGKK